MSVLQAFSWPNLYRKKPGIPVGGRNMSKLFNNCFLRNDLDPSRYGKPVNSNVEQEHANQIVSSKKKR